jgi:HK97 family phage prohead protease/HK97 family phage major capsid protein
MQNKFFVTTDNIEVKSADTAKDFSIAGYANTIDKDRTGDIVLPEAWVKGIDNFRRNPILLYQHDHNKPIGRVKNITVDKKGIFVEATVSNAAENQHGVKTLIQDGVLKSFSVGFKIKDADYERATDAFTIKDVELLEISVVSVPANQNSLFSVRKSFEEDTMYEDFKKQFIEEETEEDTKDLEVTTQKEVTEIESEEEKAKDEITSDPMKPIPFVNLLNLAVSEITNKTFVVIEGERYKTNKIATADSPSFIFEKCDINGEGLNEIKTVPANDIVVINPWELSTDYDINLVLDTEKSFTDEEKTGIISKFKESVKASELDLISLKTVDLDQKLQKPLNDTINLVSLSYTDWGDSHYQLANKTCKIIDALKRLPNDSNREKMLNVYGHNIQKTLEEKKSMTTENVGDPITINTNNTKSVEAETETKSQASTVSEPRVAELVEKTGKAIIAAEDAKDAAEEKGVAPDNRLMEEVAELKGQLKAYREQVNSMTTSKMHYQEQSRTTEQFSDRDKANAVFLSRALNKGVFDTRMGDRMKAVLSDSNLYEAFSTNIYHEMQQQLVVAPMFRRIEINTRDFRIPVADEDQSDFVAQFPSGSFNAGPSDTTTVPTTRQSTIGAVNIQPKKFMVATHIAKDEEEDTIIPLVDFLRQAATRRLARGMDKAILRGDGSITSDFSTSNALASAGVYASVVKGLVELANSASLLTKTGTTATKATPANIAAARLLLGKYGLALGENLAYITSVEGYNNLVTNTDFQTVDKFGSQATYLTGSVGAVYGIPIYISEFMDSASAADSNLGVMVYKPGFVIGERRAMEIESEYLPQQQVTAMYLSTRMDFKALTTVSAAALSARYSYASLITSAS